MESSKAVSDAVSEISYPTFSRKERLAIHRVLFRVGACLGDTVVCQPAAKALRDAFPNARIDLMLGPLAGDVVSLGYPGDRIYRRNKSHTMSRRFADYEIVIDVDPWHHARPFYVALPNGTHLFHLFRHPPAQSNLRVFERLRRNMGRIGVHYAPVLPRLHAPQSAHRWVSHWFTEQEVDPRHELVVTIQPGSGWPYKRWMPERYAALADELIARYEAAVVILTGTGDGDLGTRVYDSMRRAGRALLVPNWSLPHVAALLEQSALFVGNDSGVGHLAAALACPVVAIFGPTNGHSWGPATDRAMVYSRVPCVCKDARICGQQCLRGVTVPEVVGATEALLTEVVGRANYPALDAICVSDRLTFRETERGTVEMVNPDWKMPMEIHSGGDYICRVLDFIEETKSACLVQRTFPEVKPLLAQLLRHGLVVPCTEEQHPATEQVSWS